MAFPNGVWERGEVKNSSRIPAEFGFKLREYLLSRNCRRRIVESLLNRGIHLAPFLNGNAFLESIKSLLQSRSFLKGKRGSAAFRFP